VTLLIASPYITFAADAPHSRSTILGVSGVSNAALRAPRAHVPRLLRRLKAVLGRFLGEIDMVPSPDRVVAAGRRLDLDTFWILMAGVD